MTPPNSRTNRSTPLSQGEIARAALELVDLEGVEGFSMRRLAESLGVTTMAIYHHFQNKAEVLQAAADQVWIDVALLSEPQEDPVEELIHGALAVRRAFMKHPDLTMHAVASPNTEAAIHLTVLTIVERFQRAGVPIDAIARAYQVVATYTLGSALMHSARGQIDRAIRHPVSDLANVTPFTTANPGDIPAGMSVDAYRSVRESMGNDPDLARFEQGLRDVVAGFLPDPDR